MFSRSVRMTQPQRVGFASGRFSWFSSGVSSAGPTVKSGINSLRLSAIEAERKKVKKRIGRGQGSGTGKTSGKGHKGQKARSGTGKPGRGFEGGQTKAAKRQGNVRGRSVYDGRRSTDADMPVVRLSVLAAELRRRVAEQDNASSSAPLILTIADLVSARLVRPSRVVRGGGVKVVSDAKWWIPVASEAAKESEAPVLDVSVPANAIVEVTDASKSVVQHFAEANAQLHKVFYNRLGLQVMTAPHRFADRLVPRFCSVPEEAAARGMIHPSQAPSATARPDLPQPSLPYDADAADAADAADEPRNN